MITITRREYRAITEHIDGLGIISEGIGTEESHCSLAAINLAIRGELQDEIPDCMSEVVGDWIIRIQDAIEPHQRNSLRWRYLLPRAAGTGREHEMIRYRMIYDWLWAEVAPALTDRIPTQVVSRWVEAVNKRDTPLLRAVAADIFRMDRAGILPPLNRGEGPGNGFIEGRWSQSTIASTTSRFASNIQSFEEMLGDDVEPMTHLTPTEVMGRAITSIIRGLTEALPTHSVNRMFWGRVDVIGFTERLIAVSESFGQTK